jgi:hypothetical protein
MLLSKSKIQRTTTLKKYSPNLREEKTKRFLQSSKRKTTIRKWMILRPLSAWLMSLRMVQSISQSKVTTKKTVIYSIQLRTVTNMNRPKPTYPSKKKRIRLCQVLSMRRRVRRKRRKSQLISNSRMKS